MLTITRNTHGVSYLGRQRTLISTKLAEAQHSVCQHLIVSTLCLEIISTTLCIVFTLLMISSLHSCESAHMTYGEFWICMTSHIIRRTACLLVEAMFDSISITRVFSHSPSLHQLWHCRRIHPPKFALQYVGPSECSSVF